MDKPKVKTRSRKKTAPGEVQKASRTKTIVETAGITECVFPGDLVVIVPDPFAASFVDVLIQLVAAVQNAGIEPEKTVVMQTEDDEREYGNALRQELKTAGLHVRLTLHEPDRRQDLAMLGTSATEEPIALHREIVDADVLIVAGKKGANESAIFPRFTDRETLFRLRQPDMEKTRQAESREVLQLLNIAFTLEID